LKREPFASAYSLAEALDTLPATVLSRLHNLVGIKTFNHSSVQTQMKDDQRQVTVAKCGELLHALEAVQRTHFHHIITGDESWFHLEHQHASR
jgi:hypothetical protein